MDKPSQPTSLPIVTVRWGTVRWGTAIQTAAIWAAVVSLALPLVPLGAQQPDGLPTPDQVPELAQPTQSQAEPTDKRAASRLAPSGYGVVNGWDLYAGSVYANTSPLWFHAEGVVAWLQGNQLPALVTSSPPGTPRQQAGVLGFPDTNILFGEERVDEEARGGFRTTLGVRLGHWFDRFMDSELEFGVMWIGDGQSSGDFYAGSAGERILARPFDDAELGMQDAQLISFPNVVWGDILIETSSDLLTANAAFRQALICHDNGRVDWLAGYRYIRLQEDLFIGESLLSVNPGGSAAVGTEIDLFDEFRTWNEFHGGDLGLQLWTGGHGWTVEVLGKLAVGTVARTVEINGATLVVPPVGSESLTSGGLYTAPTNIGRFRSCRFSASPELTIRLRRPISRFFTLSLGYTATILDHVVRTGDQIDTVVNPTQLGGGAPVGPPRPTALMHDSTLWVHGFTMGLEW